MLHIQKLLLQLIIFELFSTFGVRTPWRWHSSAETYCSDKRMCYNLYICMCF